MTNGIHAEGREEKEEGGRRGLPYEAVSPRHSVAHPGRLNLVAIDDLARVFARFVAFDDASQRRIQ